MNVRIFWVFVMEFAFAQTRPLIRKSFREWSQNPCWVKGKYTLCWMLRGSSNPQRCIMQDSAPNILPTELFWPNRQFQYLSVGLARERRLGRQSEMRSLASKGSMLALVHLSPTLMCSLLCISMCDVFQTCMSSISSLMWHHCFAGLHAVMPKCEACYKGSHLCEKTAFFTQKKEQATQIWKCRVFAVRKKQWPHTSKCI